MSENNSGIILYPAGEIQPNLVRQLGVVTNAIKNVHKTEIGTAHAVAYDPALAIEAVGLFYPDGLDGRYFPPLFNDSRQKLEEIRKELQATALTYLKEQGYAEARSRYATENRRFDLIGPNQGNIARIALSSLGVYLNLHSHSGPSTFNQSAHPWVYENGEFTAVDDLNGTISLSDFRSKLMEDWSPHGRVVRPTAKTLTDVIEEELTKVSYPHQNPKQVVMPGVKLERISGTHSDVYKFQFEIPIGDETKRALEAAHEQYDQADNENWSNYDSEGDMFGDYRPVPVVRQKAHEIASAIDPIGNDEWKSKLN